MLKKKVNESHSGPKPRDPSNCLEGHSHLLWIWGAGAGSGAAECCPCSWIYFTQSSPACQEDEEEVLAKQELGPGPGPQGGLICLSTIYTTELGPFPPPAC